jgi:hypothetical protein
MSVSEAVSVIAEDLHGQLAPLSGTHSNMLRVLKEMPRYVAENALAEWEAAYRASTVDADESDVVFRTIESVYELGAFNLFAAFDAIGVERYYRDLQRKLLEQGLSVRGGADVSYW